MNDPLLEQQIREQVKRELQANNTNTFGNELAGIAGFFAGSGLGLAAVNPLQHLAERRTIKAEHRMSEVAMNEKQLYHALRQIFLGRARFEDYGESAELLRKAYEDGNIRDMIQDSSKYNRAMQDLKYGNVIDLNQAKRPAHGEQLKHIRMQNMKRALPFAGGFNAMPNHILHPAVSIGGLAGTAGAHLLYERLNKKE